MLGPPRALEHPGKAQTPAGAAEALLRTAGKVLDGAANAIESLFGASSTPAPPTEAEQSAAAERGAGAAKEAELQARLDLEQDDKTKRRQALFRKVGREIEQERDELELGRDRTPPRS